MFTMHKQFSIAITVILFSIRLQAQVGSVNTWDVPVTEVLISHSKKNHAAHQDMRNNQGVATATVSEWKHRQNQFKQLTDQLDQRLSSVFIVLADVAMVYEVSASFQEMMDYQQKTFELLVRYPYGAPLVLPQQQQLYRDAVELFSFVQLMVLSYGELTKMKVSSRQAIYRQLRDQVYVLRSRCYGIYQLMTKIDFAQVLQQTQVYPYVQKDKAIVQEIINIFK
jgi:hypothetical protein